MRVAFALPSFAALLAACAAQGSFPSLAPRAVESELGGETPSPAAPAIADDPALAARIGELVAQARQGQAAFEAAIQGAEAAAAGSGPAGSEAWTAAQVAISRAEAARLPTVNALAELDALGIARARQPTSAGDLEAVTAATAEVQAIAVGQRRRIDSVRALLSPA